MKYSLAFLALFLATVVCSQTYSFRKIEKRLIEMEKNVPAQLAKENKVKTSRCYSIEHPDTVKNANLHDAILKYEFGYDVNGNVVEQKFYYPDGTFMRTVYEYNNSGQKTSQKHYNTQGNLDGIVTFKYEQNRLTEEVSTVPEIPDVGAKTTYQYDRRGKLTCKTDYLNRKDLYMYDKKGNLTQIKHCDQNGELINESLSNNNGYFVYEYDKNDSIISSEEFESNGNLWLDYRLTRNNDGLIQTELAMMQGGREMENNIYSYDGKGRMIEKREVENGYLEMYKFEWFYGKNNLLEKHLITSRVASTIFTLFFEYETR